MTDFATHSFDNVEKDEPDWADVCDMEDDELLAIHLEGGPDAEAAWEELTERHGTHWEQGGIFAEGER